MQFFVKKKKEINCCKSSNKLNFSQWVSWKPYIKLTHNATMFWFCKEKKQKKKQLVISKHVQHLLDLPLLNSHRTRRHGTHTHTRRRLGSKLQNFFSAFVHYSHNSQKLVIFNGVRFKLTRQKIQQTENNTHYLHVVWNAARKLSDINWFTLIL